ncbi:hypothetical protein IAQ61_006200 [Plenodomus lingam]|uniref:uncharacterized protein n=1 Tax=Leptosphaeria maculans TaxID=5022 RepID=UPI00332F0479|nr:hypothetical protein IAQ61_006200 [Plenodomus lingam]
MFQKSRRVCFKSQEINLPQLPVCNASGPVVNCTGFTQVAEPRCVPLAWDIPRSDLVEYRYSTYGSTTSGTYLRFSYTRKHFARLGLQKQNESIGLARSDALLSCVVLATAQAPRMMVISKVTDYVSYLR